VEGADGLVTSLRFKPEPQMSTNDHEGTGSGRAALRRRSAQFLARYVPSPPPMKTARSARRICSATRSSA
jgi:hypothetical protein